MVHLLELEQYAKENNVPIMLPDGIEFLLDYIKEHRVKKVLEIGTAIGYSAIMMTLCSPNLKVTTIERDEQRYLEALIKSAETPSPAIKTFSFCNLNTLHHS